MARYTSLRVGGPADILVEPATLQELLAVNAWARERNVPVLWLGNGTNLVVRSGGIRGLVVSLRHVLKQLFPCDGSHWDRLRPGDQVHVRAGAGVPLTRLVHLAIQQGLVGLSFAVGIPGTIGGAIAMNAGTEIGSMWDAVVSIRLLEADGHIVELSSADVPVSYRCAKLPAGSVALEATLRAVKGEAREVREEIRRLYHHRLHSQPLSQPNAGSVFKNPPGERAGRLIDQLGLKGYRMGDAQVSPTHANFIVNLGQASPDDVLALVQHIKASVYTHMGLLLEEEINIVGESADDSSHTTP
jgi:UDP-N-acetylmuramate dehydrogenase